MESPAHGHRRGSGASASRAGRSAGWDVARSHEIVLLQADSAALLALAHRQHGNREEAERRRPEALNAYDSLGAEGLRGRLERDWAAADRRQSSP